jgi:hypothetical protein
MITFKSQSDNYNLIILKNNIIININITNIKTKNDNIL